MNELLVKSQVTLFAHIVVQSDNSLQRLSEIYTEILFTKLLNSRVGKQQKNELKEIVRKHRSNQKPIDIDRICQDINKNSSIHHRLILLLNLLEFGFFAQKNAILLTQANNLSEQIRSISELLRIPPQTFSLCSSFVSGKLFETDDRSSILIVKSNNPGIKGVHFIERDSLEGYFVFAYFRQTNSIFFKYFGKEPIQLNSKPVHPKTIYAFYSGSVLTLNGKPLLYYSRVIGQFKGLAEHESITLSLKNIQFSTLNPDLGCIMFALLPRRARLLGLWEAVEWGNQLFSTWLMAP